MAETDLTFVDVIAIGAASLAPGELWCVFHPDGPLEMTASDDLTHPIRLVCEALKADWDDLQEQGYYLGKLKHGADQ